MTTAPDAAPQPSPRYRALWLGWALANLAAFIAALLLPLIELRQLFVFSNEIVLLHVPLTLLRNGEPFLAIVVFAFGIALPLAKALLYCAVFARPGLNKFLGPFAPLAFFDVFMIALLIFVAKGTVGADASTGIGIFPLVFFAVSTKALDLALGRRDRRNAAGPVSE